MEVNYTGLPTPAIHWFREGVEIQPSRDFQISHFYQKSYLVVPEVFLEDAGTFTVRAISPVGMAECRALLVVEGIYDCNCRTCRLNFRILIALSLFEHQ
jgi:hypothetical protein